jgi:hypothetical protein
MKENEPLHLLSAKQVYPALCPREVWKTIAQTLRTEVERIIVLARELMTYDDSRFR